MSRAHEAGRRDDGEQPRRRSGPRPSSTSQQDQLDQLQRAAGNAAMGNLLDPRTAQRISSQLGGGQPLSEVDAGAPRAASPESLDAVRIHDDAEAADLSERLSAVAFTFGRDIFLAGDAPALESPGGQEVLSHELTHVRQQDRSGVADPRRVSSPDSPAEREAADVAGRAPAEAAPAAAVHRQEDPEEEELMLMAADTVHRQEDPEEEELMLMPDDTVHRQEDEEEDELMLMPTDMVHRQDEEEDEAADQVIELEPTVIESQAPANPALAALFDATVVSKIIEASDHMAAEPPEAEIAMGSLLAAVEAIGPLQDTYQESDPLLHAQLSSLRNGAVGMMHAIGPMAGRTADIDYISRNLNSLLNRTIEITPTLH